MTSVTLIMDKEDRDLARNAFTDPVVIERIPEWVEWSIRVNGAVVTSYKSGKVLVQGKNAEEVSQALNGYTSVVNKPRITNKIYPEAGSDEVGCGDYFGPIVVAACLVKDNATARMLKKAGVKDSKLLSDRTVLTLATLIKKVCLYKVVTLSPVMFNSWHMNKNMVDIKCLLHDRAWCSLLATVEEPKSKIIDQFCTKKRFENTVGGSCCLTCAFETKADGKYVSVMCAAILARAKYLEEMKEMSDKWGIKFPKGAGYDVDIAGAEFLCSYDKTDLMEVAKFDFKNTKKILDLSVIK